MKNVEKGLAFSLFYQTKLAIFLLLILLILMAVSATLHSLLDRQYLKKTAFSWFSFVFRWRLLGRV